MCPQMACTSWCKVTLLAFVWLFSTVHFNVCPQSTCITGCKVTLVAFVWLFPTVRFQMCPQIACLRRCKVALVAFVWPFPTVYFQMSLQIACLVIGIVTLIALLLPVTKFRRSHKNFCIVSVFMILLHHYQVGSEETKAFPQHYQLTFSGHWSFKITFSWKWKSESEIQYSHNSFTILEPNFLQVNTD